MIRVLVSAGGGRLHFVESANALHDAGVDVSLVLGLIPSARWSRFYDWGGRLLGRKDMSARLRKRIDGCRLPRNRVHGCGLSELAIAGALAASRFKLLPETPFQALTWKLFGLQSRRYLPGHEILHVRSGAGRGGVIAEARRRGMRVVVDHSIAHPAAISRSLGPVFRREGRTLSITPQDPFWRQVLLDCAEADVVLVNSDFVRDTFVEAGYDPQRIRVVYLGVREDFHGLKKDFALGSPIRLLFTGSFELRKGADTVVGALNELRQAGINCELHVLGNTSEAAPIVSTVRDRASVHLHGSVPQDALAEWLARSDLYVFPTLAEGCAKSAMEALSAGLPVITTPACGLPPNAREFYREIEPNSVGALASAVRELVGDQQRRECSGRGATDLVARNYSWAAYGQSVRSVYDELLQR